jgi:uncharacterized protein (TIGR03437 family)
MKNILLVLAAIGASAFAQSSETAVFVAALSPDNEVPAVTGYAASGTAVLYAHVMRDAQGQIASGSVDFVVFHNFPDTPTLTGLHIHTGAAGTNGPVAINTGIGGGANAITVATARGNFARQAPVMPENANALAALRGLFNAPQNYYVNLHSTNYPGGVIRGQVYRAERAVLLGRMSPRNEIPAITDFNASAVGMFEAVRAYDADYRFIGGAAVFNVDFTVPEATTFTGLHIHTGGRNVNGGVVINTGLNGTTGAVESPASGSGNINRRVEIMPGTPAVAALEGLFDNPNGYYMNLHSTRYPGGVLRSQMFRTESIGFPLSLSPANEVPPVTGLAASAAGTLWVDALRDGTGAAVAAHVTFDVNYRFPAETRFTGLHVHDGKAGANGPVTINSRLAATDSATGFGNFWFPVNIAGGQALTSLNAMLANPENHYVNLHTSVNAGGAVRGQVGAENNRRPVIVDVISAVSDANLRTVAPLGQVTIFGNDLIKVPSNLSGLEGATQPVAVNGTSVTIGGVPAPVLAAGYEALNNPAFYIVAQVPAEVPAGPRAVVVKSANGESNSGEILVAPQAPAIYFDGVGGIIARAATLELVRPEDPARAGENLAIISTGLGQTTPPLGTGEIPQAAAAVGGNISVTVGGQAATVAGSSVIPNFLGFYVTLFQMPAGVASGTAPVVVRAGDAVSNTVLLPVR